MAEGINSFFIINNEEKNIEAFDDSLVLSGKSLYEVIRVINGVPLFLENHLERLYNSAEITNLKIEYSLEDIKAVIIKLIKVNKVNEGNIKIVFNFKENHKENSDFYAYFVKHSYPSTEQYKVGVPVILYHGERINPNAKVINTDFRSRVDAEIAKNNVYEAILVDRDGNITEGSKSNIFMVKGNQVITAPLEAVLPGITREVIMSLCRELGIEVREEKIYFENIKELEGLFISGTSPKVLPICKVDNIEFNSSTNKTILTIMEAYNKNIEKYTLEN